MNIRTQILKNSIRPKRFTRPALTLIELLVLLVVIVVLLVALILLVRSEFALRRRTACGNNLKQIGTGLYTYCSPSSGNFPSAAHIPAVEIGVGRVSYAPKMIGVKRGNGRDPESGKTTEEDIDISTTRNLWTLVRIGATPPKLFVCPSGTDMPNEDNDPKLFWDFKSYNELSYGYQVPYGKYGKPSSDLDQRVIVVADKGPYSAALENGQPNPGVPNLNVSENPDAWMKWNSPNHGGEGQNVLYADSHVDFVTKPTAGIGNDNIYTRWSGEQGATEESARAWGTPPTSNETPWSDKDSLIYP